MLRLRGARCWNRILSTHLIQRFFTYGVNSISAVEFSWDASRSIRCTFELLVSISRNHCLSSKSIEGLTSGILQRVSLYLQRKPQALCSNGFGKIIVPGKDGLRGVQASYLGQGCQRLIYRHRNFTYCILIRNINMYHKHMLAMRRMIAYNSYKLCNKKQ
ncbi:uncharacterized protein LOC111251794 isoform X2 [Varroa destructor]|uniref:Uncharacterized protein n=1 Tax=Varroa destructor TaxID=109461 RepID=A0A7M7MBP4_VARDE|nr:uncharacterized protein LOC111251794 isoform X2 [Varroa destructor]